MSDKQRTQMRGNCQCCGRDHAVVSGHMSKHGYTVNDGWFSGVCRGEHYPPIQNSRERLNQIVLNVRNEIVALNTHISNLKSGKVKPKEAKLGVLAKAPMVPFDEAAPHFQEMTVKLAVIQAENRIRSGHQFCERMMFLAGEYHGQPLREVVVSDGPDRIQVGDQRMGRRGVLTCTNVSGARVYWKDEKGFNGWAGSRAWRALPEPVQAMPDSIEDFNACGNEPEQS